MVKEEGVGWAGASVNSMKIALVNGYAYISACTDEANELIQK